MIIASNGDRVVADSMLPMPTTRERRHRQVLARAKSLQRQCETSRPAPRPETTWA